MSCVTPAHGSPAPADATLRRALSVRFSALLAIVIAVSSAMPALCLQDPTRDEPRAGEVCTEVEAYSFKIGKAERRQREEEARHDAFTLMAERVWTDAFEGEAAVPASSSAAAALRARYQVNEKIGGGRYGATGDKKAKTVEYCLPVKLHQRAMESLRTQRAATIDKLDLRFFQLEGRIAAGEMTEASSELAALRSDVITESLQFAAYESEREGRTQAYRAWLMEWGDQVPVGPDLVGELTGRAQQLMEQGALGEADRYVNEALEIDRNDETARQLRYEIQERRNRQTELLAEAEELARDGRYQAAEWKLDEAQALGADDAGLLEATARAIDGLQAADRVYNPGKRVQVFTTMGSMGADTSRIEERVSQEIGFGVDASTPLSLGAGGSFRVGRKIITGVSASWGFSQATNVTVNGNPLTLFDILQVTAGAGYATRRSADRSFSYQLTGGLVWERVDVDGDFAGGREDVEAQGAYYLRFSAERKNLVLFIQHGFGFDDDPDSLVGWSDKFQIGVGGVF